MTWLWGAAFVVVAILVGLLPYFEERRVLRHWMEDIGLVPARWESNATRRKRIERGRRTTEAWSAEDVRRLAAAKLMVHPSKITVVYPSPAHVEIRIPAHTRSSFEEGLREELGEELPVNMLFTIRRVP